MLVPPRAATRAHACAAASRHSPVGALEQPPHLRLAPLAVAVRALVANVAEEGPVARVHALAARRHAQDRRAQPRRADAVAVVGLRHDVREGVRRLAKLPPHEPREPLAVVDARAVRVGAPQ
eukprot:7379051-Prymnesium_polylepis.1